MEEVYMLIKCITVGQLETNCYIVTDEKSLDCAVIDPGDESNSILDYIEENHLKVKHIFLTHGHFDHTGAVGTIVEETGATVWVHEADAQTEGKPSFDKFYADCYTGYYKEGDMISVGDLVFRVLETPGHSKGSVTLVCGDVLFTGDTLFHGSCGRTDLPGGDMKELIASLRRLYELPGDKEVYPGHMDPTTLNAERGDNYYMRYAAGK